MNGSSPMEIRYHTASRWLVPTSVVVVAVDRLEDLFGAVFRDERLFADGDQVPQGIELVGPDIGVGVSARGIETGDVILEFLALFVFRIPPQLLEALPALVEDLLDVLQIGR